MDFVYCENFCDVMFDSKWIESDEDIFYFYNMGGDICYKSVVSNFFLL